MSRGGVRGGFGMQPNLTEKDYDTLWREVTGLAEISPEVRAAVQVVAGNQNTLVGIWGVSADFAEIRFWRFQSGENFTDADVRNAAKVCLMGKTTAASLFGEGIDPVGQTVSIQSAPVTVVGWLASKGANRSGQDQDDIIIMPYTSVMKGLSGDTKFRAFSAAATGPDVINDVTNQITAILRQTQQITGDKEEDFSIRSQQEMRLRLIGFVHSANRVWGSGLTISHPVQPCSSAN